MCYYYACSSFYKSLAPALIFDAHKQLHLRELLYGCEDRSLGVRLGVGVVSFPRNIAEIDRFEWVRRGLGRGRVLSSYVG